MKNALSIGYKIALAVTVVVLCICLWGMLRYKSRVTSYAFNEEICYHIASISPFANALVRFYSGFKWQCKNKQTL